MTKALARLLQERTSDGYVLRVDLRLRPDPASTPVALSTAERLCLLRDRRPELGARRAHQGAPGRGRHRARRALPRRPRAVHLAQVFRLCGDRRHPCDEAPDPRRARPRAGRRSRPRHQARARRHPRDRVLRPDAAAHLRRPPSPDARGAHARHARAPSRRQMGQRRGGRRSERGLCLPAPRRAPAADGRRRADAAAAVRAGGARPLRQVLRLRAARRLRQGPHPSSDRGRASLRAIVRGRAGAQRRLRQSRLHRRRRRSGDARDLALARISSARRPRRRPFAAGISAAARRSAAPARARC